MRRQRGFSIGELMIAMTLGAVVTLLATALLLSASAGYVAHTEAANVNDAGRFALATIERAVRQAAFVDRETDDAAGAFGSGAPPSIAGLDAASLSSNTAALNNPRPDAVNGSDVLALRFDGSGGPAGDGSMTNCAGFAVGTGQDGWSIFYVGVNAAGNAELRCKYRGAGNWGADAVIGGVDSFQVLYGLDTDPVPDGLANSYVNASAIIALDGALALDGASAAARERDHMRKTHWKRVASIKVALLLHGAKNSSRVAGPAVFNLFGPAYSGAGFDRGTRIAEDNIAKTLRQRERRSFASTILLRNQVIQ